MSLQNDICPRCMELLKDGRCVNESCDFKPRPRKPDNVDRPRLPIKNSMTPLQLAQAVADQENARATFHVKLTHPRRVRKIEQFPIFRQWAVRVLWRHKLGDYRIPSEALEMAKRALKMPGGHDGHKHDWSKLKSILAKHELRIREQEKQRAQEQAANG